jgi:hypothetical protein
MENKKIKDSLFLLLLLLLISPIIEQAFNIVKVKALAGAIEEVQDASFTPALWFDKSYQEQKERYLNQHFGFRNICIRVNNQLAFSFWHEARANGVIIGKDNYMYEENYIKAYFGEDFVGESKINDKVKEIKFLQDTLKKLNIDLILIFAAGKGTFYPEFIPEKFQTKRNETNLEFYLKRCKELGINFIDFNTYFVNNKNKSPYPLYPQYGIHWSSYGWTLAADSIIKFIENLKQIDIPDMTWHEVDYTSELRDNDNDIVEGMNLLFIPPTFKMGYPKLIFEANSNKRQPHVLAIADSYYWQIFNAGIPKNILNNGRFWFYNKQIYPDSYEKPLEVSQINLKSEIEKQDVVLILGTDATLPQFGWGFIESAYKIYFESKIPSNIPNEQKIKGYEYAIRNTPDWLKQVQEKAIKKSITLDSMIRLDAIWMTENENKK